eukprot:4262402-Amphidinium_carterae.3
MIKRERFSEKGHATINKARRHPSVSHSFCRMPTSPVQIQNPALGFHWKVTSWGPGGEFKSRIGQVSGGRTQATELTDANRARDGAQKTPMFYAITNFSLWLDSYSSGVLYA